MELRHLRYFVAVAEELHFNLAADRLHVTQPAVSEQIRKLEGELGVRLFDRTHRQVSLTGAGTALLREARRVLDQAEIARLAARSAPDRPSSLRIGYVPVSLPASVPRALHRLTVAMPHVENTLEPGRGPDLVDAVRAEKLDAAVVSLPTPVAGLRVTGLGDQCPVAAFPVGHDHAMKTAVRLKQIAPRRLVVLPRDADRPFYDSVIAACRAAVISPTLIEMPDGQVERALLAVASGAGMAILPGSVGERYAGAGVRLVPLDGEVSPLATAVVSRRDTDHMPTVAFLRAISQGRQQHSFITKDTSAVAA